MKIFEAEIDLKVEQALNTTATKLVVYGQEIESRAYNQVNEVLQHNFGSTTSLQREEIQLMAHKRRLVLKALKDCQRESDFNITFIDEPNSIAEFNRGVLEFSLG